MLFKTILNHVQSFKGFVYKDAKLVESYNKWEFSEPSIVDEIARAKGHKYLTLVYQLDKGQRRLLWIGKDRTKKTFHGFFDWFGVERSAQIKANCSDQWKAYLNVIKKRIPKAIHILDRFHIVANMNKALDKVRNEEAKRMRDDGYEPILTKTKWLLLRRSKNLTPKQSVSLDEVLEYNLKTVKAYILKEEFQKLWEYKSPAWASKFIDTWCKRVMYSKIEPMKKQAESIRRHKPLILNWFKAKKRVFLWNCRRFKPESKTDVEKIIRF